MTDDDRIRAYLDEVRSFLHVPGAQRTRVLDELEWHIRDGTAAHEREGDDHEDAVTRVIEELGPPDVVAAAFLGVPVAVRNATGVVRWLPMLLPLLMLTSAVGFGLASLRWFSDGLTRGERALQWDYVRRAAVLAVLTLATGAAIRRADLDRSWRFAAWFGTALALLALVVRW